ncbi:hypothetical protein HmCmsJML188_00084 [Escherichia coli]|nr:hypothetical protein HmCmsJML188_00084 [Escherichia coli]
MVIHKYVVLYLPSEFQKTPSRDKKFGKAMTLMLRYIVIARQDGDLMIPQKIFMPGLRCPQ